MDVASGHRSCGGVLSIVAGLLAHAVLAIAVGFAPVAGVVSGSAWCCAA
jgi:hypothetical protein